VSGNYSVKPKADLDLDDYADYLADKASLDVALHFFSAAEETFSLLATQPNMGWHSRLRNAALKSLRVFSCKRLRAYAHSVPAATGRS